VEGVDANTHVEGVLAGRLGHVLVGANTGSLESLGGELLILVGNLASSFLDRHRKICAMEMYQVDAVGELVDTGPLAAKVIDAD
jgi:hypothetical protein